MQSLVALLLPAFAFLHVLTLYKKVVLISILCLQQLLLSAYTKNNLVI